MAVSYPANSEPWLWGIHLPCPELVSRLPASWTWTFWLPQLLVPSESRLSGCIAADKTAHGV